MANTSFCNAPASRNCWGEYSIDTDYYTTVPETGKVVEVWLSAEETACSPDGYERTCMTFNGTVPGPLITADWGDDLVIHVTNNMKSNGTSVHWHGIRMLNNTQNDGVPGISQCPIAPGETYTYKFRATQYGTSWYHSHFSLQYAEGLWGPMILRGPATANYDDDLGTLVLQDWSHTPIFGAWANKQEWGITHELDNILINGTNIFDCSGTSDPHCTGNGKKFEAIFQHGKKYLIRVLNVALDSYFNFHIDGHNFTVIASDFVPIDPYETDSIMISSGQRYDIIVDANAEPGDYWLRSGWQPASACQGVANSHPDDGTGIIRYERKLMSAEDPITITSEIYAQKSCHDESLDRLVPYVKRDVGKIVDTTVEDVNVRFIHNGMFKWTINSSFLDIDWAEPTLKKALQEPSLATFPSEYNVLPLNKTDDAEDQWVAIVIENAAVALYGGMAHPIHFHGHDFYILAQEPYLKWDGKTDSFQLKNPPRRDTAMLPPNGYLAVAIQLDNPGAWLVHCHIAWHASMGLALEIVESAGSILVSNAEKKDFDDTCSSWSNWWNAPAPWPKEDSGI
ncbi:multicopper oxidase [Annulohypoxylon maeteangense]|uniref:multicopper oxidase n=1 Tax=Annulohypoxylon maeteangense TaxID=1927788 RepID=UPI0020078FD5|nr:multicopper oxidase [Annulohypoxylon maeteangense]KAI0882949.1 multicopper oxidase [Annulohypoxylon maeteangense]